MIGSMRLARQLALAVLAISLVALPAAATPLGLSGGDEILSLEFDSLKSVSGDGSSYDASTLELHGDGRITSVTVAPASTSSVSGVDLTFDLHLISNALNLLNFPIVPGNADFIASTIPTYSVVVREGGVNILTGDFAGVVRISGVLNVVDNAPQPLGIVGTISFNGGNQALINALGGGLFVSANVLLGAGVFDFAPGLFTLAGDGNIFNSNFTMSMSGTLTPFANAPFVPEPATVAMLATGLLGIMGLTRRVGSRR